MLSCCRKYLYLIEKNKLSVPFNLLYIIITGVSEVLGAK
jgi:hypothetical protein